MRPLAAAVRRLGLDEYILAGASVRDRPASERTRILSDVMEALLGAVYVDSRDINRAADAIRRCILAPQPSAPKREPSQPRPRKLPARPPAPVRLPARLPAHVRAGAPMGKDYKSQLQDIVQK